MTAIGAEGKLGLDSYCWRSCEEIRDRLVAAGAADPLALLAEGIERDVTLPDDGPVDDLRSLVAREIQTVRVVADVFAPSQIQAALRASLALLRQEP
jgi:hypothetical protein